MYGGMVKRMKRAAFNWTYYRGLIVLAHESNRSLAKECVCVCVVLES